MSIPEEIRNIPRPKNTIVKLIGTKYAVIERIGCKRINGKNIPLNGSVIGHIVDGKYIEKNNNTLTITMKNYGDYKLFNSVGESILSELEACYDKETALYIYLISLFRAINHNIKDYQIVDEYNESYISNVYSNLNLSKNKISKLIEDIGKDYSKVLKFMQCRIEKIDDRDKIAIDGMLKTSNGRINSLNDFSYKSRIKSSFDISLIIAFNATNKEILCSIPYFGNLIDMKSFPDFINKTGIKKAFIIGDKGMKKGDGLDNIGYIFPLKRTSKIIGELDLYNMNDKLDNKETPILCKKINHDNKYYYAFKDLKRFSKEQQDYFKRKKVDLEKLKSKEKKFGTVVYVSNQDLTCKEAYNLYQSRWEIELVNKFYKGQLGLNTVREHSDYSIYGSEFINLLSSIIANRVKNKFDELGLFKEYTYKQLIKITKRYKKIKMPRNNDIWYMSALPKKEMDILSILNI